MGYAIKVCLQFYAPSCFVSSQHELKCDFFLLSFLSWINNINWHICQGFYFFTICLALLIFFGKIISMLNFAKFCHFTCFKLFYFIYFRGFHLIFSLSTLGCNGLRVLQRTRSSSWTLYGDQYETHIYAKQDVIYPLTLFFLPILAEIDVRYVWFTTMFSR